jgi:hypothetical protein
MTAGVLFEKKFLAGSLTGLGAKKKLIGGKPPVGK